MHFTRLQLLLPQRQLCQMVGWLAERSNPVIRWLMIHLFRLAYRVDMQECERTKVVHYASFNDFFTRRLKAGERPIDQTPASIVSPVDGTFSCLGSIDQHQLMQAKNHYYRLDELLIGAAQSQPYVGGSFATIYLAPSNYHRVHIPLESKLESLRYVPGKQFSVNGSTTRHIPNIYARNERLIAEFSSVWGNYCLIMVGALLVAGMSTVVTGKIRRQSEAAALALTDEAVEFSRGDEFGTFQMGSTVILLFPPGTVEWKDTAQEGKPVRLGTIIGSFVENPD